MDEKKTKETLLNAGKKLTEIAEKQGFLTSFDILEAFGVSPHIQRLNDPKIFIDGVKDKTPKLFEIPKIDEHKVFVLMAYWEDLFEEFGQTIYGIYSSEEAAIAAMDHLFDVVELGFDKKGSMYRSEETWNLVQEARSEHHKEFIFNICEHIVDYAPSIYGIDFCGEKVTV